MKLLNLLALLLLPPGVAVAQKPAASPKPSVSTAQPNQLSVDDLGLGHLTGEPVAKPPFNLTELQKARMDAARQEVFRWQDKMTEAVQRFSAICAEAQKENKWPAVQCSLTDLTVEAVPPPLKPADK